MQKATKYIVIANALGFTALGWTGPALGRDSGIVGACPTFNLDLTFGLSTYKSELVGSNDTGTGLSYTLGGWAGSDRTYGFHVKTDTSTTAFELNESAITVGWQDAVLRYRMGFFYAGVVFGHVDMTATVSDSDVLDAAGSGYGANTGILVPINRIGVFYLDVTSVTYSQAKDGLGGTSSFGSRLDIDAGGNFDLTREAFDVLVGYRQRTYGVTATSAASETYLITYLGIRAALFF